MTIPPAPHTRLAPSAPPASTDTRVRRTAAWALGFLAVLSAISIGGAQLADPTGALLSALTPLNQWLPALSLLAAIAIVRPGNIRSTIALRFRPVQRSLGGTVVALGSVAAVPVVTVAICAPLGLITLALPPAVGQLAALLLPVLVINSVLCLGEEVLWRGWLQAAWSGWGWWRSSVTISVLWAGWHVPLLLVYANTGVLTGRDVLAGTLNIAIAGLLLSALRVRYSSVWPAVTGHAAVNTFMPLVYSNFLAPSLPGLPDAGFWAVTGIGWCSLAALIWLARPAK